MRWWQNSSIPNDIIEVALPGALDRVARDGFLASVATCQWVVTCFLASAIRQADHRTNGRRFPPIFDSFLMEKAPPSLPQSNHRSADRPALGHLGEDSGNIVEVDNPCRGGSEGAVGQHLRQVRGRGVEHRGHLVGRVPAERGADQRDVSNVEVRIDRIEPASVAAKNVTTARGQELSEPRGRRALHRIHDCVQRPMANKFPYSFDRVPSRVIHRERSTEIAAVGCLVCAAHDGDDPGAACDG